MNNVNNEYIDGDYKNGTATDGRTWVECGDGYYVSDDTYDFYVPKNCSPDTPTVIYRHGSGGFVEDQSKVMNYLENNSLDAVVVIPKGIGSYQDNYESRNNYLYNDVIPEIHQNEGIKNSNISEVNYSNSYASGMQGMLTNIEENNAQSQIYISIDGKIGGTDAYGLQQLNKLSDSDIALLKQSGTQIIAFERASEINDPNLTSTLKRLSEAGVEVMVITGSEDHGQERDNAIANGAFLLATGDTSCLKNFNTENGFSIYRMQENGQYTNLTIEQATTIINNNLSSSNADNSIISVEYQFINSYMDKLKTAIKDTNILSVGNITTSTNGSATLLSAVNAFNSYSNNSAQFLSSLSVLQNNILVIAQSYANLDSELAGTIDSNIINSINSIDLSAVNKFFDTPLAIDISNSDGNILISRETLSNFTSESNLLISTLLTDISDTKEIKSIIDSFTSESTTKLQGEEWDIIRNKCNEFSELCDKKINYAQSLIDGITDACKKLLDYLEDYDELDTSKISEYENELISVIKSIESLNEQIIALKEAEGTFPIFDGKGNVIGSYTVDNSGLIASCRELIKVCEQIQAELERVLNKLYGLAGIDKSASDIITNTENENKTENISQNILSGTSSGSSGVASMPNYETDVGDTEITNNIQQNNQNKNDTTESNNSASSNNTILSNDNTSSSSSNNNVSSDNNTPSNENNDNQVSSSGNNASTSDDSNNVVSSNNNILSNSDTSSSSSNNNVSSDNNVSSSNDNNNSQVSSSNNTLSGENNIETDTATEESNQSENVTTPPTQDENKTESNINQNTTITPSVSNEKSNGVKSTILKVVGGIGVAAGAVGGAIGIKKKMDKNNQIDEEENRGKGSVKNFV